MPLLGEGEGGSYELTLLRLHKWGRGLQISFLDGKSEGLCLPVGLSTLGSFASPGEDTHGTHPGGWGLGAGTGVEGWR